MPICSIDLLRGRSIDVKFWILLAYQQCEVKKWKLCNEIRRKIYEWELILRKDNNLDTTSYSHCWAVFIILYVYLDLDMFFVSFSFDYYVEMIVDIFPMSSSSSGSSIDMYPWLTLPLLQCMHLSSYIFSVGWPSTFGYDDITKWRLKLRLVLCCPMTIGLRNEVGVMYDQTLLHITRSDVRPFVKWVSAWWFQVIRELSNQEMKICSGYPQLQHGRILLATM